MSCKVLFHKRPLSEAFSFRFVFAICSCYAAGMDLFDQKLAQDFQKNAPLADRMRPQTLDEFVGQDRIVGTGTLLRKALQADELFSIILWGPPGSGKTTLARLVAQMTKSAFIQISAVTSGVADLKKIIEEARERRKLRGMRSVLFVDEVHRWNKAQQDALLPHVETGTVTFIGATTENPSFEVIGPLLSRSRVFVLDRLSTNALQTIIERGLKDADRGLGSLHKKLEDKALAFLAEAANGDARTALNALEIAAKASSSPSITLQNIQEALQQKALLYDKGGEEHYNTISAFIKSMRGSQPDATLYWLMRMVEAGEDPLFIARRMVVFASEDISLADTHALPLAVACFEACNKIGFPECTITLSHVAVYLALAPKDNSTYVGMGKAAEDVQQTLNEPVPLNLRNAPTKLMKDLGYHKGYKYAHDFEPGSAEGEQKYLPEKLKGRRYYSPKPKHR